MIDVLPPAPGTTQPSPPTLLWSAPVLIVDDTQSKRLAMAAALAPLGHRVVEADSGVAALRRVMEEDFAVILLDVNMPDMDGFETAKLIRERWQSSMTPIIFVTAHSSDEIGKTDHYAGGAVDFLFAPIPPAELRSKVSFFAHVFLNAKNLAARSRVVQDTAEQLRALTDAAPIGIFQTDANNRYIYTNDQWSEITGVTAAEAVGRDWESIVHGEWSKEHSVAAEDGAAEQYTFPIERVGSGPRVAFAMTRAMHDGDGKNSGWVGTLADVTDVREAQAAQRFQAQLLGAVGEAVIATDLIGTVRYWNEAAERLYGFPADQVLGRRIADVTFPTDIIGYNDEILAAVTAGQTMSGQFSMNRPDGTTFTALVTTSPFWDEETGALSGIIGVSADISDLKTAQDEVWMQSSLLEQARHSVVASTADDVVVYMNPEAERQFGWSSSEAIGRTVGELNLLEDPVQRRQYLENASVGDSRESEVVCVRKDGSRFPAVVTDSVARGTNGDQMRVLGVALDLTELRAAEQLAASRLAMFDSVLNSVEFPVAVVDEDGTIEAVNDSWDIFALKNGGDPAAVGLGVNYFDVCDASDSPDAKAVADGIRSILAGETYSFSQEYRCDSPTEQRWFQVGVTPEKKHPRSGAIIVHLEITALRQATERAESLAASRINLIASVSHELRTPLAAVLGFASLCDPADPQEVAEFSSAVREQAMDMSAIVEDLLIVAKTQNGNVNIVPESFDLAAMAISTTNSMAIRTTESITNKNGKGISMAGDPVTVYADPLRTRQIIRNLVANATKHGGDKITLTTGTNGSVATLTVSDNGSGIPHEQTEQMFDLFWSEQRSVTNPGSIGIGLAVSRALAQAMQGALTYERTVDGTNAFTLELPMHRHIASSEIG